MRDPGQSLRETIQVQFDEIVAPWIAVAILGIAFAFVEWIRWGINATFQPIGVSIIAFLIVGIAIWRITKTTHRLPQLKLGLRGERHIGQLLQAELLPHDYYVIHDICIDDANIDHAVIGPRGIFAVEVKTITKPSRGKARVAYDGSRVLVNGYAPDRDPLIQARAEAKSLEQILEEYTGRRVVVRPVVLYPEWFVDEPKDVDVWVLNEQRFLGYVEHEPIRFTDVQVRELANGLMRYVRDQLEP